MNKLDELYNELQRRVEFTINGYHKKDTNINDCIIWLTEIIDEINIEKYGTNKPISIS